MNEKAKLFFRFLDPTRRRRLLAWTKRFCDIIIWVECVYDMSLQIHVYERNKKYVQQFRHVLNFIHLFQFFAGMMSIDTLTYMKEVTIISLFRVFKVTIQLNKCV